MDLGLRNKNAFIAASSQGLGKSVAMELAREGANVAICGRNKDRLAQAKEEIEQISGRPCLAFAGDLSNEADRKYICESVLKAFEKVDILVTNSGGPPPGRFEDFDKEAWRKSYEQLLESVISMINYFLPGMKNQKSGRIIAITSQAVKQPVNNLILSNTIRISVVGLIKSLSNELGEYNITVNNVMPGYTKTERLTKLIENDPAVLMARDGIPLKRFAEPHEFAAAVTFLASERASYITGISLAVDGGWIKSSL